MKQSGLTKKIGIISLIENTEKAINNKQFEREVFIDSQKAFNSVNHNILFESHYGITGKVNQ